MDTARIKFALIALLSFYSTQSHSQIPDSLYSTARNTALPIEKRIIAYDEIGFQTSFFDPSEALIYADSAVLLSFQTNDSCLQATALNGKSIPYLRMGKFLDVKETLLSAIATNCQNPRRKAGIFNKLGISELELGQSDIALDYFFESLKLLQELNDTIAMAQAYSVIGETFTEILDFKNAKIYSKKSLELLQNKNATFALAGLYGSLSTLHFETNNTDSALIYIDESIRLFETLNAQSEIASTKINKGIILRKLQKPTEAISSYEQAEKIARNIGDTANIFFCLIDIANIYYDQEKISESKSRYEQALVFGKKIGLYEKLVDPTEALLEISIKQGYTKDAISYKNQYIAILDSVYNQSEMKALRELQTKFETTVKEKEIADQKAALAEQESLISQKETYITLLIIGLLILIIAFLIFYNNYKISQQQKLQAAILTEKEKGFQSIITATENERKQISKDLHDGIGQQLSALKMALTNVTAKISDKTQQEEMEIITEQFSRSADEVREISHQMMPRTLMDFGLVPAIEDMLRSSFRFSSIFYSFEHHKIDSRFDEKIEISLYRILQELVNNIIKHSEANEVAVQLIRHKKKLVLFVEDNGKGMNDKSSEGHGLINIKSRLELINGTVNYEPSPESGTSAIINVPI